jgi:hypothetical protein
VTARSLASSTAGTAWLYTRPAFGRTGRSLSENNFAKERRDWLAILLREVLQNGLDARVKPDEPVVVSMKLTLPKSPSVNLLDLLIPSDHKARFTKSVPHLTAETANLERVLVIEDFGTSGLIGVTDDPDRDGKGQNWNAFWFREGEGGKEHGSGNGGAGQGKITYFSTSAIRTIFTYTVRADDGREALYGASSFLRDYEFEGVKWLRDSYWGVKKQVDAGAIAVPTNDGSLIQMFRDQLGVTRKAGQTGLSLVIPSPRDFSLDDAIQITIAEFFAPIVRGDLVVIVGDTRIEASSIIALADSLLPDTRALELHTCTTKGFRAFYAQALERSRLDQVDSVSSIVTAAQLSDDSFTPDVLASLREALNDEKAVAVRFPVVVKPRVGPAVTCYFDVHLMVPEELDQSEQAILRRDLLIGEEPLGGGALRQSARGLTVINDLELSKLLLSAEEPTHLRWNAKLPRLREYYKSGPDVVSFVRNAMAKLLEVLTGGDRERDFRLLAKYFAAPGTAAHSKTKGRKSPKGKYKAIVGAIPPPKLKKLEIIALEDGCKVVSNKSYPPMAADLPISAEIEFAYEGLDKDAFSEYDPLDFDLADSMFQLSMVHCTVLSHTLNKIEFAITQPDFELMVKGFDKNLRLRVRLNYEETRDATLVDTE